MTKKEEPKGRAKGGHARAEALTASERSEIGKSGAVARWALKATHEGTIKIGDMEIQCAVLEDGQRVLSQSGFMVALGRARQAKGRAYYEGDVKLPAFLTAKNLRTFISEDLEVTSSQIQFKMPKGGLAFGYPAELLPKVCQVFIDAEKAGALDARQQHIAERARVINAGLQSTGIVALIDEATGFQLERPQNALQMYLEMILQKELAAWIKRFPDEFYENIYKLKGWPWPGMSKNRYSVCAHYTRDLVYERLAPGLLEELERRTPPDDNGNRPNKLHQWMSEDVGHPLLAQHLHALIMFQRAALASGFGWTRFMNLVDMGMPKKDTTMFLPGVIPT